MSRWVQWLRKKGEGGESERAVVSVGTFPPGGFVEISKKLTVLLDLLPSSFAELMLDILRSALLNRLILGDVVEATSLRLRWRTITQSQAAAAPDAMRCGSGRGDGGPNQGCAKTQGSLISQTPSDHW